MKQLKYTISTLSPVLVSSESGNQFMVPTKDYIPGLNIIGALAAKYIRKEKPEYFEKQQKPKDENFYNWFINGGLCFSNAYKVDTVSEQQNGNEVAKDLVTHPLPFSVHHIKNDENEILDLLYKTSDKQTKSFGGFGLLIDNKLYKTKIRKSTSPHHKRDYKTGAPEKHIFFNYESIDAHQTFEGIISGEEKLVKIFYEYFNQLQELRVGRSRTSEYGKVKFSLSEVAVKTSGEIKPDKDDRISLTFLSNVIVYNKNGYPSNRYSDLKEYIEQLLPGITIDNAFLRTEEIENYVSVWKLKKPSEVAFQAGSCLLLNVGGVNTNILAKLQAEGLGERRHEGFGRIAFGLQKSIEKISKAEFSIRKYPKPSGKPTPQIVVNAVKKLADEYLEKEAAVEALKIVKKYAKSLREEKKITSSQISRLEGLSRISKTEKEFRDQINKLRKISKDKLDACDFANTSLLTFLTTKSILDNPELLKKIGNIETLISDVDLDSSLINLFKTNLFKTYYSTLFAAMRKALKGGN